MIKSDTIEVSGPQEAILSSTSDANLFMAGVGSGKSHSIGLLSGDFVINHPNIIQFIAANTYSQLSKSTLKRVFQVWKDILGFEREIDYVVDRIPPKNFRTFGERLKSYENTISFANGALIFTASLDNYKMIDGTEFGVAFLDETKDTKEEAVKEVITARLRQPGLWVTPDGKLIAENKKGSRGYNPLYIFTSPAKVKWINEWFELTDKYELINKKIYSKTDFFHHEIRHRCVVISSTYHNEHNLTKGFIERLLEQYKGNKNLIEMLIYGSPIAKSGGEFIKNYKRLDHVKPQSFNKSLPLHTTIDINVVPYLSALDIQIEFTEGKKYIRVIKEHALESPRNKMSYLCDDLKYSIKQTSGFFYYGDPTGLHRNALTKEYDNYYDVIQKELYRYVNNNTDSVLRKAPPVTTSRDFVDACFAGNWGFVIEIDPSCKQFLNDLEFAKEDANGAMIKPKKKNEVTGQIYEELGHHLDNFRYFMCSAFDWEGFML